MDKLDRKLIGIDLDGVIAHEDSAAYKAAKLAGVSALRNYYRTAKLNTEIVRALRIGLINEGFRYRIYTARKDDIDDIEDITYQWLEDHGIHTLFDKVVFTKYRWKWPWLIKDRVYAHIDNDATNLKWYPFMYRIVYNGFIRHGILRDRIESPWIKYHDIVHNPAWLLDFIMQRCYTK